MLAIQCNPGAAGADLAFRARKSCCLCRQKWNVQVEANTIPPVFTTAFCGEMEHDETKLRSLPE